MIKTYLFTMFLIPFFFSAQLPTKKEIDSLLFIAYQDQLNLDIIKFIRDSKVVLSKSEQIGYSKAKITACVFIANGLYGLGDYQRALRYISLAEKEKFTESDFLMLSEICIVKGNIYSSMEFNGAAIKLFKEGIEHSNKIKNDDSRKKALTLAYQNLIGAYEKEKKFDSMYVYLQKGKNVLNSFSEKKVFPQAVNFYSSLGQYYTHQKKYDSAAYSFSKAENLINKYKLPYISANERGRGLMEMEKNNADAALAHYFKALENAKQNKLKSEEAELYSLISSAYLKSGNGSASKEYKQKALHLENQLHFENKRSIEYISNTILKDEINKTSKKNYSNLAIIIGSFLLLLVLLGLFYFFMYKRNKEIISEKQEALVQKDNVLLIKEKETETLQQRLDESFFEVVNLAKGNSPEFFTRFTEIYPEFRSKLLELSPHLRTSELTFCAYLFLNFSTKDIADFTFTSPRTVQTRKYNIRKKLNIPTDADLYIWIQEILTVERTF